MPRRWVFLFTALCLVVGPVLSWRSFVTPPPLEELTSESGMVRIGALMWRGRSFSQVYRNLSFTEDGPRYRYLSWFPKANDLDGMIHPALPTTIWTDERKRVWQIEQNDQPVVSYAEIREAFENYHRHDWALGAAVFGLGILCLAVLRRDPFG